MMHWAMHHRLVQFNVVYFVKKNSSNCVVIFRQMRSRYFRLVGPAFHRFGVPRGVNGTYFHFKWFNFGFGSSTKPMLADFGSAILKAPFHEFF